MDYLPPTSKNYTAAYDIPSKLTVIYLSYYYILNKFKYYTAMAANGNVNGYGNMNGNGRPHPPVEGANNEQPTPRENISRAEPVAAFR